MTEKSVFLADGEKHVRAALCLLLDLQPGYVVTGEASHAESLLAQVCQAPPALILLDWKLPGLHPQRMFAALRQHCPQTRILVISVRSEHEKIARKLGADSFLLKQLAPDQFLVALADALIDHQEENLP